MTAINYTCLLLLILCISTIIALPVFIRGLARHGTGKIYEPNFVIQRLPQLVAVITILVLFVAYLKYDELLFFPKSIAWLLSLNDIIKPQYANIVSFLGLIILIHGLTFMIGGWYSLGNNFSTDSEILPDQKISTAGVLGIVMHPVYSGIIQSLLGASLIALSPIGVILTLYPGTSLWINRAKYEENLLVKEFGDDYLNYAKSLNWHRIIPNYRRLKS